MEISTMICGFLGIMCLILAILFAILRDKSTMLLSGFNTMTKNEREKYDTFQMAKDTRNLFFTWTVILLAGALCSKYINEYLGLIAIGICTVLFIKNFSMDAEKAFAKYKK